MKESLALSASGLIASPQVAEFKGYVYGILGRSCRINLSPGRTVKALPADISRIEWAAEIYELMCQGKRRSTFRTHPDRSRKTKSIGIFMKKPWT